MSDIRSRLKKAEDLLGQEGRDSVIEIWPPKYAEETDEAYRERMSSSQALPRDVVKYARVTITLPARAQA